jgi:PAS domain S-box-containing protein
MDECLITTYMKNYIDKFFCNAPNYIIITKVKDGKYIEVNETFAKCMGLRRQDMIGHTSVEIGPVTVEQRLALFNEIKEKGYAKNIELEVIVKNNEVRYGLFNVSPIKMGKDALWMTVVTDISESRLVTEARQDDILFKSLATIERTGIILIRKRHNKQPYSFFINEEAKRALNGRPVKDLLYAIDKHESTYFSTETGCYRVKTILTNHDSHRKIILLEPLTKPDTARIKEKLKQYDLTRRQEEIAFLATIGHSNKEIAEKLFVTIGTVKDHLKKIFPIIGVYNRSELCPKILGMR